VAATGTGRVRRCGQGIHIEVGDDPPPGSFEYAEQPEGGWAVVGFNISDCPA
jgi:hypothetical protein